MVTVINRRTQGQDVFFYRPDPQRAGQRAQHPQRAAKIDNSGKLTLEPGPVTIFARGTFVGEGLISRLHPGQTAFIPYAVDSSASVRVNQHHAARPATFVSLIDGVCHGGGPPGIVTATSWRPAPDPGQMVVKHPRRAGYELQDLPPGTSTTAAAVLIPFPISPSSTCVLTVRERKPVRRTIWIQSGGQGSGGAAGALPRRARRARRAGKKKLRRDHRRPRRCRAGDQRRPAPGPHQRHRPAHGRAAREPQGCGQDPRRRGPARKLLTQLTSVSAAGAGHAEAHRRLAEAVRRPRRAQEADRRRCASRLT